MTVLFFAAGWVSSLPFRPLRSLQSPGAPSRVRGIFFILFFCPHGVCPCVSVNYGKERK